MADGQAVGDAPRSSRPSKWIFYLLGGFGLLIGLVLAIDAVASHQQGEASLASWVKVDATVSQSAQSIARMWPPGSYYSAVELEFETPEGEPHHEWIYGVTDDPAPGSLLAVAFPAGSPDEVKAESQLAPYRGEVLTKGVMGLVLLALSLGLIRVGRRERSNAKRYLWLGGLWFALFVMTSPIIWIALLDGAMKAERYVATDGVITAIEVKSRSYRAHNTIYQEHVRWELDGQERVVRSMPTWSPGEVGDARIVLYDPATRQDATLANSLENRPSVFLVLVFFPLLALGLAITCFIRGARARRQASTAGLSQGQVSIPK